MERIEQTSEQPDRSLTRRDLFGLSWRALTALALGQGACIGLRFLSSRKADEVLGKVVTAGVVNDFDPGTITPFDQDRFFLIRLDDGGFLALYTRCTHLACVVSWDDANRRFICPCHGSEFSREGAVINPPAPRPLDRLLITFDGSRVQVDTGTRIQRQKIGPEDLVYAPILPTPEPKEPGPAKPRPGSY